MLSIIFLALASGGSCDDAIESAINWVQTTIAQITAAPTDKLVSEIILATIMQEARRVFEPHSTVRRKTSQYGIWLKHTLLTYGWFKPDLLQINICHVSNVMKCFWNWQKSRKCGSHENSSKHWQLRSLLRWECLKNETTNSLR